MKTLYLRNVPDEVAEALAQLADEAGMSTSAYAVKELTGVAARLRTRAIFEALPAYDISTEAIVDAVRSGRDER